MFFLLTPPHETEWHVTRADLIAALRSRWPEVDVLVSETGKYSTRDVVWRLDLGNGELEGAQDHAGQTHQLDGQVEDVALYAWWWRQQVPAEQPLILCSEDYSIVVELTPDLSNERLTELLAE